VDLAGDWSAALPAAGFDPDRPAMWLVEGVLQYLEALAVTGLLDGITASSAAGSHLLVGFVGQSLLDHSGMQDWLAELAERGMTWRYGTDEPEELLAPRGWHTEVNMLSAVGTRLGRWPFPDAPRGTPGVPHGYLVHAHR
jgi:methyltransferase (TIGR00027 family)